MNSCFKSGYIIFENAPRGKRHSRRRSTATRRRGFLIAFEGGVGDVDEGLGDAVGEDGDGDAKGGDRGDDGEEGDVGGVADEEFLLGQWLVASG